MAAFIKANIGLPIFFPIGSPLKLLIISRPKFILYYYLVCETIGTAVIPGLLCQPRVIVKMTVEKQMECRLERGNRSSRRKPAPAPLLPITKSHMTRPWFELGPPRWETGDQPPELWYGQIYPLTFTRDKV
jgi:hypothetical protein